MIRVEFGHLNWNAPLGVGTPPPEIMNTDQGIQFTGASWITALAEADVRVSMDLSRNVLSMTGSDSTIASGHIRHLAATPLTRHMERITNPEKQQNHETRYTLSMPQNCPENRNQLNKREVWQHVT